MDNPRGTDTTGQKTQNEDKRKKKQSTNQNKNKNKTKQKTKTGQKYTHKQIRHINKDTSITRG